MPFNLMVYIQFGFLLVALLSNGWQYIKSVHASKSLQQCQTQIALQNVAITNQKTEQEKLLQYKIDNTKLASEILTLQNESNSTIQAPEDCEAARLWGINEKRNFE